MPHSDTTRPRFRLPATLTEVCALNLKIAPRAVQYICQTRQCVTDAFMKFKLHNAAHFQVIATDKYRRGHTRNATLKAHSGELMEEKNHWE